MENTNNGFSDANSEGRNKQMQNPQAATENTYSGSGSFGSGSENFGVDGQQNYNAEDPENDFDTADETSDADTENDEPDHFDEEDEEGDQNQSGGPDLTPGTL